MTKPSIVLKKVSVHNLKEVDLTLNSHELILFTGVSGSGKSSMAFDTIFVEGQRRYIESLSTFAKRSLGGEMKKPDIESVSGLSPTLAIEQKSIGKNPRSTVGTLTEIYDHLRLLFARVAHPHCPISQKPVTGQSREKILHTLQRYPEGHRLIILAPYAKDKKGEFKEESLLLVKRGFLHARVDGKMIDLDNLPDLEKNQSHTIDIVIDRLRVSQDNRSRLAEAIIQALEMGGGMLSVIDTDAANQEQLFSTTAYSAEADCSYPPLEPSDFSFNSPSGMCPTCHGLGRTQSTKAKNKKTSQPIRFESLERICPSCLGSRLKPYPSAARLGGQTLLQLCQMTIQDFDDFFEKLALEGSELLIAEELINEIRRRLHFLKDVGLHYLCLDRTAPTLSGGEAQRVRLASQVGCGLVGVTYILDEPSIGLHARDNHKLIASLKRLRDQGNTVIVVEHDEDTILSADRIVDFGPGAGKQGGKILVNGTLEDLLLTENSLTGQYLSGKKHLPLPTTQRTKKGELCLYGARHHNLKNCTLKLPLGVMTVITGVSGSGKSSLICETLQPALSQLLNGTEETCGTYDRLEGVEQLDKVIVIDQSPIGKTPRSNPATYIKLFDDIRELFSSLPESRAKGYTPARFSFNLKEGACSQCHGMGMICIDMDFLEDQWMSCPSCDNQRFDSETLSVMYKGHNIHDVLAMTVEQAWNLFEAIPSIQKKLTLLKQVGLGYLTLGQFSTTLSGGEAQRIKLAKELVRPATGRTLYILDEPTTGLHFHDVAALLSVLQALVDKGNSVVLIEHHLDVIKIADWVIELGPEAGDHGGQIIAEGTPIYLKQQKTATGYALAGKQEPGHETPPYVPTAAIEAIGIYGAKQNNLKHLDIKIPYGCITVCTGPSGSGKSSLAFDTIYAEGQRRYVESLSPYARQFIKQMPKPNLTYSEGLCAAIAIEQKQSSGNSRSTVGTQTEIYDYLRIVFSKAGVAYCPKTGERIQKMTLDDVVNNLMQYDSNMLTLLAPLTLEKPLSFQDLVEKLRKLGFLRLRLNKKIYELDEDIPFDPKQKNSLALVVDRLKAIEANRSRLFEAVENCALHGLGNILVVIDHIELFFNLNFAVQSTGQSYAPITPHTFSFNRAEGMCLDCGGLGIFYSPSSNETSVCPSCLGSRLNPLASHVRLGEHSISSLCHLPLNEVKTFLLSQHLDPILDDVYQQILSRLDFLCELGLDYLCLDRSAPTLSYGESQRIRLARQLGSALTGVLYVLDEPTVGLHPHDNIKLNVALQKLKELGNTLLLVEHDPLTIQTADYILEFGPGAGHQGGYLVAQGTYQQILNHPTSLTGDYLNGRKKVAEPRTPRQAKSFLRIEHAKIHNLKDLSFDLPIGGVLCTLTGVSGSGKSTLMRDILRPLVASTLAQRKPFDKMLVVDQNPIGHTVRADVGTYTDVLPTLRQFYCKLPAAQALGLQTRHFSTNHRQGMCRSCWGLGYKVVDRLFLPPVKIDCDQCLGLRLNPLSLTVSYKDKNFGNLLHHTIDQALELFSVIPKAKRLLETLQSVGLGYLKLGQEIASLSGGEAQRLKLCSELSKRATGTTLFLLDEPTTGLHPDDIRKLLCVLNKLVDKGNTCILIEHQIDVIQASDWIIDMGPGAGQKGGEIVAMGRPQDIANHPHSLTGRFLSKS